MCTRMLLFLITYEIAKQFPFDPLFLGMLGLVQAIPALSLALVGGHTADHFNRRSLLRATACLQLFCAVGLMVVSYVGGGWQLGAIFAFMFFIGVGRGFADPTIPGLEAQILPRTATVSAATWGTLVWHACAVMAPVVAGAAVALVGVTGTYPLCLLFSITSIYMVTQIRSIQEPLSTHREPLVQSLTAGWRFVLKRQILWTAMALDLFAVLFGGAVAMLPLFANHVLHVGPIGLGFLNAAPMLGALTTAILCIWYPPRARAGHKLLASVFGFGISMIVFALSTHVVLSCVALFVSGLLDGLSVVIRKSILRLYSPNHMRGRVAAVSSIFVGASNELGELESGIAAHYLGLVRSVWLGGIATLLIVGGVTLGGKELRQFDMIKDEKEPDRN